jgi:hypothetical protein
LVLHAFLPFLKGDSALCFTEALRRLSRYAAKAECGPQIDSNEFSGLRQSSLFGLAYSFKVT